MNRKMLIVAAALAVLVSVAALGSASASNTAPKPGLLPGKWQGTGTISGSITDDAATTTFSGKLGFRLNVAKNLSVTGSGSWVKEMKGRGIVSSDMTAIARLVFTGTARDVRFGYAETVDGTITANGIRSPVQFDRAPPGFVRLVISRARTCSASGSIPVQQESGVTITWTAKRLGCRG